MVARARWTMMDKSWKNGFWWCELNVWCVYREAITTEHGLLSNAVPLVLLWSWLQSLEQALSCVYVCRLLYHVAVMLTTTLCSCNVQLPQSRIPPSIIDWRNFYFYSVAVVWHVHKVDKWHCAATVLALVNWVKQVHKYSWHW